MSGRGGAVTVRRKEGRRDEGDHREHVLPDSFHRAASRPITPLHLPCGFVHVVVKEGRDLKGRTKCYGEYDPFVRISYGTQTAYTKVQRNAGEDPQWNENVRFPLLEAENVREKLRFTVFDRNYLHQHTVMGEVSLELSSLEGTGRRTHDGWIRPAHWIPITLNGSPGNRGEILLEIQFQQKDPQEMLADRSIGERRDEKPDLNRTKMLKKAAYIPVYLVVGTIQMIAASFGYQLLQDHI